jgi:poly(hydroxyalkanoate) depolymerase family esterase
MKMLGTVNWNPIRILVCFFALYITFPMGKAFSGTLYSGQLDAYRYSLYLPTDHDPQHPLPLLVALHGCKQNAVEMIKGTGFNELADKERFVVLYPETRAALNNPFGCWIWWSPDNQRRDSGEPGIVVQMIDMIAHRVEIDRQRIYVTGISSGGSLSAILASIYPDIFAAAGAHSGLQYAAAATPSCGLKAMRNGGPDPEGRGELAYHLQGRQHRIVPVIVFQGEDDSVVNELNADQLIAQIAQTHDFSDDADSTNDSIDDDADAIETIKPQSGYGYTSYDYKDSKGAIIMQKVLVEDLGHAWSGGNPAGSYTDPEGPDASAMMWAFFKRWSLTQPALIKHPTESCTEKLASNFLHFSWYRSMSYTEYICDPWRTSWRYSFGDTWGSGRCPSQ